LKKQIHFSTVCWGESYVLSFLNINLASLLSPQNLPNFANHFQITYFIYTTRYHVKSINDHRNIHQLQKLANVFIIKIEDKLTLNPINTHHHLWKKSMDHAKKNQSLIAFIPPDTAWSENSFTYVSKQLLLGVKVILMGFLRVDADTIAKELLYYQNTSTSVITITGSELVKIGLSTIHPLSAAYLHNSPFFPIHPEMVFWPLKNYGLLCRILIREMFIFDPHSIDLNNVNLIQTYIDESLIKVVENSDDLFAVSLTKLDQDIFWYENFNVRSPRTVGKWWAGYDSWVNDNLASKNILWHYHGGDKSSEKNFQLSANIFIRKASIFREINKLFNFASLNKLTEASIIISFLLDPSFPVHVLKGYKGCIIFLPKNIDAKLNNFKNDISNNLFTNSILLDIINSHYIPNFNLNLLLDLDELFLKSDNFEMRDASNKIIYFSTKRNERYANNSKIISNKFQHGNNSIYIIDNYISTK
jgi:hypothetical protein